MRRLTAFAVAMLVARAAGATTFTGTGTIDAIDDTVQFPLAAGAEGATAAVSGTWTGSLRAEVSADNGVSWSIVRILDVNAITYALNTTASGTFRVCEAGGMALVRISASSLTAGAATVTVRPSVGCPDLARGLPGTAAPTMATQVMGTDGTNGRVVVLLNGAPAGTEYGVVTRNIPFGTQAVSGTVTANQGGAPWSENITQLGGTAIATGGGASTAGTARVAIATDQNVVDTELPAAAALGDSVANPTTPAVGAFAELWNGSTWERQRGNNTQTALSSAARTATATSATLTSGNARGVTIYLDVTAVGGPAGQIDSVDVLLVGGASDLQIATWGGLAITTTGVRAFQMYPGSASAASWTAAPVQAAVPRAFKVRVTHGNANSITYSCSVVLQV